MLEKIETFDQNQNAFKYHQIQLNLQRNAIFVESSKIYFLLSPSTRTDIYIKMLSIDPQNTKKEQTRIRSNSLKLFSPATMPGNIRGILERVGAMSFNLERELTST